MPAHRSHSFEDWAFAGMAVRQPANNTTLALRRPQTTFQCMCGPESHDHLILNGMMMSLANVNWELFVPPPKGVVLFKEAS